MTLDPQGASHRRSALGATQQSTSLYFLLDVAGQNEPSEDVGDAEAVLGSNWDLALFLHSQGYRERILNGARGYFLPLPRAPGV